MAHIDLVMEALDCISQIMQDMQLTSEQEVDLQNATTTLQDLSSQLILGDIESREF